jgi:inhibitor of cysteine peptidase
LVVSDPSSPLDLLVRALVVAFLMVFGVMSVIRPPVGSSSNNTPTTRSPLVIEKVEVLTLESYPYQLSLEVSGYHPDGCDLPVKVEQRREGNTVYVEIYRDLPLAMTCLAMIVPYQATLKVEGGFESGTYQLNVNGTVVEVTL